MPGLVPGIHVLRQGKAWMAGTSPAMTSGSSSGREDVMLKTRRLPVACLLAFVVAGGALVEPARSQTAAPAIVGSTKQKLTVRFTWKLATYFTPLFVALDRGYYAAEGLDLQFAEGSGSETVVQLIAHGTEKVAYGPATVAGEAVSGGLPVTVVAVYQPKVPIGLIAFPDVPLRTPKDLEGKKLGYSVGETFANLLAPFARINNIDLSKVTRVQLETSARNAQFVARHIDVMSLYTNDQIPLLEKRLKLKFNVLKLADFGLPLLGQGFMVNSDFARTNPDVIRMLLRATAKGYADTFADPKAAIEIMSKYTTVKTDPDVMEAQLRATLDAT